MKETEKVLIHFKSPAAEAKYITLQLELKELRAKKQTAAILDKIDVTISLMTLNKTGFELPSGKIKKVIKLLKQKTKNKRVKYGTLPVDKKPNNLQFKDTMILYAERDGQIIFREFEPEVVKPLPLEVKIKAFSVE